MARNDAIPVLFLAALPILLVLPWAATDSLPSRGSDWGNYLALRTFLADGIRAGAVPGWNPYIACGLPFTGDPRAAVFSPFGPLFLLPFGRAVSIFVAAHLFVASAGAYRLAADLGAGRGGALFAGLLFAYGGWFPMRLLPGHLDMIGSGAWITWCLVAVERAIAGDGRWAAWGGVPFALLVTAGRLETPVHTAYGLLLYGALRGAGMGRLARGIAVAAAVFAAGVVLSLPHIGTALPVLQNVTRAVPPPGLALSNALPVEALPALVHPAFLWRLAPPGDWVVRDAAFAGPIGGAGALACAVGLARGPRDRTAPLAVLGLAALLLALGEATPVAPLLLRLPALGYHQAPSRALVLFVLAAAVLGGIGLGRLQPARRGAAAAIASLALLAEFLPFHAAYLERIPAAAFDETERLKADLGPALWKEVRDPSRRLHLPWTDYWSPPLLWRVRTPVGNEFLYPRAYAAFLGEIRGRWADHPFARFLGVDFLIVDFPPRGFEAVARVGRRVLARRAAPPARPAVVGAPGGARFLRDGGDEVSIEVEAGEGGATVVLSDIAAPGWRAWVDGREAPIRSSRIIFRAVAVPPGRHVVLMRYRPPGLAAGLAGLLAGAALLVRIGLPRRAPGEPIRGDAQALRDQALRREDGAGKGT